MIKSDCIVIGAGLSGLAAAITLQRAGRTSLVMEADSVVGGRVKTLKTAQGLVTDVGFQVLLSSYPEIEKFVDLQTLNLKKFNSGALTFDGENLQLLANPLVHPKTLFSSFFLKFLTIKDRGLVLKLILTARFQRSDAPLGQKSTERFLNDFGFSENFIELFWRPFLTGIFLDSELQIGDQFFKFLMRCFSMGAVSVPENGMAELPLQMAKQLPQESLRLNQKVKSFGADHVILASGERLNAKNVICTFDPETVNLSEPEKNFRSVTTHYLTGEKLEETGWGKWLVLVPRRFGMGIDHFCLISSVSEKYGQGQPLLSVSVVGPKNVPISQVLQELNIIAKRNLKLELVISHSVPRALPIMGPQTSEIKTSDGVIYCGDRWASPSINGALRSGRQAAESILK